MNDKDDKSNQKIWKKTIQKNLKKMKTFFQDNKTEILRGVLQEKQSDKLHKYLERIEENMNTCPNYDEMYLLQINNGLLQLFDSLIDMIGKIKYDKYMNYIFEILYKLIIFQGFQPYKYEKFPPSNLSKELSQMYSTYYLLILKTSMILLLMLKQSKEIEKVKNAKDKIKVKKLISFQMSIDIPDVDEDYYEILSKILSALSLRNQSLLKDIIESISTKIIASGSSVKLYMLWKSFGEYCISNNSSCKHYSDGLMGIDLKWTLHFCGYLPFAYHYFISYLYHLKEYHSICQFEDNQYPGYTNICQVINHLSHLGTSKISDIEKFHKTEAILSTFSIPHRFNEIFYDKVKRVNTRSIDSVCIFIATMTHIFQEFNEQHLYLEEVDVNVIIKTFDIIFEIDSFYAQTAMFSMLYELLPILHKTKREIIITYLLDNFDFYALHWYHQARKYFFLLLTLRITIAPSFRIFGQLLPEEQKIYDTYADIIYDREIITLISSKIELLKSYANGSIEMPLHLQRKKVYLHQALKELDEIEKIREDWIWENTFIPPVNHLELSKVSIFNDNTYY